MKPKYFSIINKTGNVVEINKNPRRDFLKESGKFILLAIGTSTLLPVLNSCESSESPTHSTFKILLEDYPGLANIGVLVEVQKDNVNDGFSIYIIRQSETAFLTMNSKCNHRGCQTNPPDSGHVNIWCGCHGSEYSATDGSVLKQPNSGSTFALNRFTYLLDAVENSLTITT